MATIKDLRIEAGLTVFQLASKSNVSISSINRIEQKKLSVKRLIASRILTALSQELGRTVSLNDVEELKLVD